MTYLTVEPNDDPDFIHYLDGVLQQILHRNQPEEFYLFRMDNWFDFKWCGLRYWRGRSKSRLLNLPFHPNRVVQQTYYRNRGEHADYERCGQGEPVHLLKETAHHDLRFIGDVAPNATLIWFSGNTLRNTRACLMVYLPTEEEHWDWYVGYIRKMHWIPCAFTNISKAEFGLYEAASSVV